VRAAKDPAGFSYLLVCLVEPDELDKQNKPDQPASPVSLAYHARYRIT
jgi:hypothetical protein